MATLRPPSTSPSPSPGPENGKNLHSRASMGPSARGTPGLAPASPRPGGGSSAGRPTSELLGGAGMFQTPEAEAIDQWFENLQNYEVTLEEMAAASLDVNFKEELSAIEQWFKVLSEAERTAALYSLLQHSTQLQIRFFVTVLQQMARSDPMTALLSPAMGGSMQNQMEAKLAQLNLKSPGLKSTMPSSPSARTFSAAANQNRQSLTLDAASNNNYLSPDTAAMPSSGSLDAASTLAQQRAKLKASNASHRISAPVLVSGDNRATWGSQLGQVAEQSNNAGAQELVVPSSSSRPKSTEFSGTLGSPRPVGTENSMSPMAGDSWASMVNTPLIPMFNKDSRNPSQNLDAAASKLNDWSGSAARVPLMDDPKKFRRVSKNNPENTGSPQQNGAVYDNDGNLVASGAGVGTGGQQQPQRRNVNGGNAFAGQGGWAGATGQAQGARSPALSNVSSNRFGSDDGSLGGMNGLGMNGFNMGMGSPGLGMGIPGMGGLAGINPLQMNMLAQMNAMGISGISPEAQLLAAQMAASGFGQNQWLGMNQMQGNNGRRGPGGGRSPASGKVPSSSGRSDRKDEDDVDPQLLNDVPAWLRSLRLHKYTPNFEGMNWKDMVVMDEAALEAKGVAALGARRKMLKTFETVRTKMGIDSPSVGASA